MLVTAKPEKLDTDLLRHKIKDAIIDAQNLNKHMDPLVLMEVTCHDGFQVELVVVQDLKFGDNGPYDAKAVAAWLYCFNVHDEERSGDEKVDFRAPCKQLDFICLSHLEGAVEQLSNTLDAVPFNYNNLSAEFFANEDGYLGLAEILGSTAKSAAESATAMATCGFFDDALAVLAEFPELVAASQD